MVDVTIKTSWAEQIATWVLTNAPSDVAPKAACLRVHCLSNRGSLLRDGGQNLEDFHASISGEFGRLRFRHLLKVVSETPGDCMFAATFQATRYCHHAYLGRLRLSDNGGLQMIEATLITLI